jgi:hypothetical protein
VGAPAQAEQRAGDHGEADHDGGPAKEGLHSGR